MKKCLLTSAGFENLAVKEAFLELVGKEPSQIKALWVPTAAGEEGGVYVGVSAGSIIAASNMRSGLQLVNCVLHVHCGAGEQPGEVPLALYPQIRLTNSQALRVAGREAKVIE